jgi:hypothetical protein
MKGLLQQSGLGEGQAVLTDNDVIENPYIKTSESASLSLRVIERSASEAVLMPEG